MRNISGKNMELWEKNEDCEKWGIKKGGLVHFPSQENATCTLFYKSALGGWTVPIFRNITTLSQMAKCLPHIGSHNYVECVTKFVRNTN